MMHNPSNGSGVTPAPSATRAGMPTASRAAGAWPGWQILSSRQRRAALLLVVITPYLSGCYTVRPVMNPDVSAGTQLVAEVTDRGRVELSEMLGPGALRVHGRLASATDSTYVLQVSKVDYLSGVESYWTGERVSLNRNYIGRLGERRLSRTRSWLAAGVVTAAVAVVAATVSLVANGLGKGAKRPTPGPGPIS